MNRTHRQKNERPCDTRSVCYTIQHCSRPCGAARASAGRAVARQGCTFAAVPHSTSHHRCHAPAAHRQHAPAQTAETEYASAGPGRAVHDMLHLLLRRQANTRVLPNKVCKQASASATTVLSYNQAHPPPDPLDADPFALMASQSHLLDSTQLPHMQRGASSSVRDLESLPTPKIGDLEVNSWLVLTTAPAAVAKPHAWTLLKDFAGWSSRGSRVQW